MTFKEWLLSYQMDVKDVERILDDQPVVEQRLSEGRTLSDRLRRVRDLIRMWQAAPSNS